ncbi:hypothetical protein AC1031_020525 [Aphanomyces cochlioides]|nr:hypothetical protein AC1031_020525 [Aphanomyces cochlioides]
MKLYLVAAIVAVTVTATPQDADLDAKAKALADKLTIEEILGQMSQIDLNSAGSQAEVDNWAQLKIGSFFNFLGVGRTGNRVVANTTELRAKMKQLQDAVIKTTNIPMIFGTDSVHGATYVHNSVLFPQSINTAATFNPELAVGLGTYMARDTKAAGIPWMFGPTLDVTRHKHWPRVYETFGEDPTVVSDMGKTVIKAIQSQGIAACFKHFITYSDPTSGLDRDNTIESSYEILNYFVPPFKAAIEADVWSGMGSFIALNSVPIAANALVHKSLLRGDLGFKGLMVTDFREINLLVSQHHYVPNTLEAAAASMNNTSYDISMVPNDDSFIKNGKQLVAQGRLSEARLRESAVRIMKLKLQLNLFDVPVPGADVESLVGDEASEKAALAIAQESLVLLKNTDNLLPLKLDDASTSIFVTGSNSDSIGLQCGGWSLWWQGAFASEVFPHGASIRVAMESALKDKVTFYQGLDTDGKYRDNNGNNGDINTAKGFAAKAKYTVLVVGERPYAEYMGNDDKQPFPDTFLAYAQALKATGTKLILVIVEGRPKLLNGLAELADAVIFAGLPCEFGGQAVLDVISGKVNPSGKMAMTYPKTEENTNLATPYYKRTKTSCIINGKAVDCPAEWHFGDGLSYTTFNYSNVTLSSSSLAYSSDASFDITVTVKNTGSVAGKETVLLFGTPPADRVNAETKLLKRYTKISLDAGEAKVVKFTLTPQDLGYYSNEIGKGLKKDAPSGTYTFFVKHDTDCTTDTTNNALCVALQFSNPDKVSFAPNSTVFPSVVGPVTTPAPPSATSQSEAAKSPSSASDSSNNSSGNTSKGTTTSSKSTGLIVGIGVGAVCLCAVVAFFVYQRRYKRRMNDISIIGGKDDQFVIVNDRGSVTYRHL